MLIENNYRFKMHPSGSTHRINDDDDDDRALGAYNYVYCIRSLLRGFHRTRR